MKDLKTALVPLHHNIYSFFLSAPFKSSVSLLLIYCQKSVWSKNNQEQCGFSFAQNFLLFEPYLESPPFFLPPVFLCTLWSQECMRCDC